MLAAKTVLTKEEIQHNTPFAEMMRTHLEDVLRNSFFQFVEANKVSPKGYRLFVHEKYSAVGYFIPLLKNAERHAASVSKELEHVFRQNLHDETGNFAGSYHEAYAHDTWRKRSLESLGISVNLATGPKLESTKNHNAIMTALSVSEDPFEVFGSLLFLELFVVYEMKHLVQAFERDMPDLFPKNGYSYDNFPFNIQEYWYGHALHDTWHYCQIEEKLKIVLENSVPSDSRLSLLNKGISQVAKAKNLLYSSELVELLKSAV